MNGLVITHSDAVELFKARKVLDDMRANAEQDAHAKHFYRAARLSFITERLAVHLEGRNF